MRRGWLISLVAIAAGCQSADKRPATPTSKEKDKGKHWLDEAKPDWAKGDVPAAGSWADPRDPKFDYANYVKGALAGYVLDLGEKPAPNAIIAVEPADPTSKVQPMVVLADQTGSFVVHGLKPNETYSLTAKVRDGGMLYVGQTHATPPSVQVRIRLKEQMNLPTGPGFGQIDGKTPIASKPPAAVGDLPPLPGPAPIERDRAIPPSGNRAPGDGGWSPIQPRSPQDLGELPMPGMARPDLTTTTPPPPWKPPTVDMPAPTPTITPPPLTPVEPKSISRKQMISLVDPAGRPTEFPHGQAGELVLVDFLSSTCVPCKKFTPELIEFQRRYAANGVELIGVLCDPVSDTERQQLAGKYAKDQGLNYLVYAEAKAGAVQKQFQVKGYPSLVLLDSSGEVLWTGHPKDLKQLESVVRSALQRR